MKRREPLPIAQIIDQAISQSGTTQAMAEHKAAYLWSEIVGPGINRYTFKRHVHHGILHVYITSAPLKHELSYSKDTLIRRINQAVGSDVITDIQFH